MRKFNHYPLVLLFAAFLFGCNSNIIEDRTEKPDEKSGNIAVTLTGNINLQTKTAFGSINGQKIPIVWVDRDKLGLFLSQNGSDVEECQNVKAILDGTVTATSGPGTSFGIFSGTLSNLQPDLTYDLQIYYPFVTNGGNSGSLIKNRISPTQVQSAPGNSSHIGKAGGFATANASFTTPSSLIGYTPDIDFSLDHKTSYIYFSISSQAEGYTGWSLKRIKFSTPDGTNISGNSTYDVTLDAFSLDESVSRNNSVTLDILDGMVLSSTPQSAYMVVFPSEIKDKTVTFEYTLENASQTQTVVLTHAKQIAGTSTMLAPGKAYLLTEVIPSTVSGEWSQTDLTTDINQYKQKVLSIITRAGIPSISITYVSNIEKISFVVVNDDFYSVSGRQQEVQPITTSSIYQACSISKIPFSYIVMKLVDNNEIDLDTPLYTYFPGVLDYFADETNKEKAKLLTPRICLIHRTGLDNSTYSNISFLYDPDTRYIYSGPGIFLLQRTVETIKNKTLDVLAKEEVFTPFGMEHTSYKWEEEYANTHLYGFRASGVQRNNTWAGGQVNAAYSMRTNSEEYTLFLQKIMQGEGLSKETYEEMLDCYGTYVPATISSREKYSLFRALGWATEDNEEFGRVFYHTGNNISFKGMSMFIPDRNITLVYFINGDHSYNINDPIVKLFLNNSEPFSCFGGGTTLPPENNTNGNTGDSTWYDE